MRFAAERHTVFLLARYAVVFAVVFFAGQSAVTASLILNCQAATSENAAYDIPRSPSLECAVDSADCDEEVEMVGNVAPPLGEDAELPSSSIQHTPNTPAGMLSANIAFNLQMTKGWQLFAPTIAKPIKTAFELLRPPRTFYCFAEVFFVWTDLY
jgi:hypothetical protein